MGFTNEKADLNLYVDYLLTTFGAATATGLPGHVEIVILGQFREGANTEGCRPSRAPVLHQRQPGVELPTVAAL